MSGNWLKLSVSAIGLGLALFTPAAASAQDEARSTSATLDTVVVTASRSEQSIREVSSNVTVISEKQIQNSTAKNLADLLKQQGFFLFSYGGTDSRVQIRGIGDDAGNPVKNEAKVQILINGRKTGITNPAPMGLNNIERIEIIRGPAAVQYGSSAMGGVVNIITKRGKEGEFWAAAESGLGSFDMSKNSLGFGGAANNIDFSAGLTHLKRGNYESNVESFQSLDKLDGHTSMNLDLGYTWFEKHRLGLNFNYYKTKDWETYLPTGGYDMILYAPAPYGSFYNVKNNNLAISYEGATEDDQFNWSAVYSFGEEDANTLSYGTGAFLPLYRYIDQDVNAFTGQVGYNGQMVSANIGLDYSSLDVKSVPNDNGVSKSNDLGGFISGRLRLLDESLIFSAGGRYDRFTREDLEGGEKRKDTHFAPSVGVAYLPLDWLKLRANYSEGFRAPSAREMSFTGPDVMGGGVGVWVINPDLKPEINKTFEFGADVNYQALNIGLTYFHSNWVDKIYTDRTTLSPDVTFNNVDAATIAGLEFSVSGDIGQMLDQSFELRPYLNLTYYTSRKNKDKEHLYLPDDDILPNTPKYTLNYGVTFNHPGYDLMANINGTYLGELATSDASDSYTIKYYTPGAVSVDLSLEKGLYDFTDKSKLKLRAEVNNLFNDDNMVTLAYPGPERSFYVGLKFEYN